MDLQGMEGKVLRLLADEKGAKSAEYQPPNMFDNSGSGSPFSTNAEFVNTFSNFYRLSSVERRFQSLNTDISARIKEEYKSALDYAIAYYFAGQTSQFFQVVESLDRLVPNYPDISVFTSSL